MVVQPANGEVLVPVAYESRFHPEEGDQLHVQTDGGTKTFTIAGFVRDSQMASSLSSATRFVIKGTMEDEVRQIGVMRAIGLPTKAITGLYLGKYSLMALIACIIGGLLGVVATSFLSQGIVKNYSSPDTGLATVLVPVIALVLVYLLVVGICRGILRGVRRIEVVGALVPGVRKGGRPCAWRSVTTRAAPSSSSPANAPPRGRSRCR